MSGSAPAYALAPIDPSRVRRLILPRVGAEAAAVSRRLARPRRPLPLPGNESFHLVPIERFEPQPGETRLSVVLTCGGRAFAATLPDGLLLGPMRALDPQLRLDPLPPPDLLALLAEAALLPLLDALERGTGVAVCIEAVTGAPSGDDGVDPAPGRHVLPIGLRGPRLDRVLTLHGEQEALEALLGRWQAAWRPMSGLVIEAALWAGTTELPAGVVRSLRPGDGILIQSLETGVPAQQRQEAATSVRHLVVADTLGAPAMTASVDGAVTATLLGTLRPLAVTSFAHPAGRQVNHEPAPDTDMAALDDIPVRLVFEAGRLELSLGELRQLGAGSVLPFSAAASGHVPGTVQILAGRQRIGLGELVEIDGHPGVRIIAFSAAVDDGPPAAAQEPGATGATA